MNQMTKTIEGLDNLLESGLINEKEYAKNVKKARLLFEGRYKDFQQTYTRNPIIRWFKSFF